MATGFDNDANNSNKNDDESKVVLVIGACCLDRLLYVPTYPEADSKIRTTAYVEMGGGNAANTATALARLMKHDNYRIQLLSKVGDDAVGSAIKDELKRDGVDLSSSLFVVSEGKTTSVTNIVVAEDDATRTCIHTPGTSGELTVDDVEEATACGGWDAIFRNVIHVHSDCRHGDVLDLVVTEAKRRQIPVSVDAEKDRQTVGMDRVLQESTMIFTNEHQLEPYTRRKRPPLKEGTPITTSQRSGDADSFHIRTAQLCNFFLQMYPATQQESKQIISTRGTQGSTHLTCRGVSSSKGGVVTEDDGTFSVTHANDEEGNIVVEQKAKEGTIATYDIRPCGIIRNNHVVDTTGAGDAFIGGYICANLLWSLKQQRQQQQQQQQQQQRHEMDFNRHVDLCLSFAAWVASKKVGGAGARATLPHRHEMEKALGTTMEDVERNLQALLKQS